MHIFLTSFDTAAALTLRMGSVMFISLFGIEVLMQLGLMKHLRPVGRPVARLANLPSESALTFLAGIGSIDHLHTMLLEQQLGLKATTIPYGGGGPASKAAMAGEVDFLVGLSTTAVRFVRNGKLQVLAVLGPKRLEALPDSPTIYELGHKDYPNISFIRGVLSPPGTPREVVAVLEAAFKKAVDDPGFREIMKKQGRPVKPFSSKDMKQASEDTFKLSQKYTPFMKEAAKKK